MVHLKKFEDIDSSDGIYWLVPRDERFSAALHKIGVSEMFYSIMLDNEHTKNYKYIFIRKSYVEDNIWGWMRFEDSVRCDYFDKKGYIFKGGVLVDIDDVDAYIQSKKYNL